LPDNFFWELASSAYQVEGAAKDEGKGPSIWDLIAHRDYGAVADNSTGDVVARHYYLYKQDFARLANLGFPYFSPSFSWYVYTNIRLGGNNADLLAIGRDFFPLEAGQ
jgi:beta-glucosidase/6-phospho-beta-glucosidase/beta-galactosidase